MNILIAYFKAFRYQNLLMIAFTMYLMRWLIMEPFVELHQLQLQMSEFHFGLLVISTVFIAAGGYLINDYFDLKIDRINKPEKIIVGRYIKRRVAIVVHWFLHSIGLMIGLYLGWQVGLWQLCFIQIFWILSMWFYSTDLKRQLISGNLIIAISLALVPLSVVLFEVPSMNHFYGPKLVEITEKYQAADQAMQLNLNGDFVDASEDPRLTYNRLIKTLFYWVLAFSLFAFLMSMAREITKDAADVQGDKHYGCKTIPIVWGFKTTKWIIATLYILIIAFCITLQQLFLPDRFSFLFIVVLFTPLTLFNIYRTATAQTKRQFKIASSLNKVTSLIGLCYAFVAFYQISQLS
jgi:4-hydroxybenzoate polyprenyltransferase